MNLAHKPQWLMRIIISNSVVDQYRLSWGEVLWEGPGYGNIAINGTECFVSSSFSKIDGKAGAQVSVTIRPRLTESNFSPVSFVFGNEILTIDMIEDLKRSNTDSTGLSSNMGEFAVYQIADNVMNTVSDSYTLIPNSTQISMYNQMAGYEHLLASAHIGRAYYHDEAARIAISVNTNAQKLYQDYAENYTTLKGY